MEDRNIIHILFISVSSFRISCYSLIHHCRTPTFAPGEHSHSLPVLGIMMYESAHKMAKVWSLLHARSLSTNFGISSVFSCPLEKDECVHGLWKQSSDLGFEQSWKIHFLWAKKTFREKCLSKPQKTDMWNIIALFVSHLSGHMEEDSHMTCCWVTYIFTIFSHLCF